MDGTLIDTEGLNMTFWKRAAASFGFELTTEEVLHIRSLDAKLVKEFLEGGHPGLVMEDVRAERRRLMAEHVEAHGIEMKPGVDEILDALSASGIKAAVATASRPDHAEDYLTRVGIYDRFDAVVSTASVGRGKPSPDVYLYACERVGERPGDCLAVEDAPNGVRSAYAAGCRVAFVPDLTGPDVEIEGMAMVYGDLGQLARDLLRSVPVVEDPVGLLLRPREVSHGHGLRDHGDPYARLDAVDDVPLYVPDTVPLDGGLEVHRDLVPAHEVVDHDLVLAGDPVHLGQDLVELGREHVDPLDLDHVVRAAHDDVYPREPGPAGAVAGDYPGEVVGAVPD